jgi:E1A/CREB-binding protein
LLSNMSTEDIQRHLDSLNDNVNISGRRIAQKCLPILNKLLNDQNGWIFKDPVDPIELGIPDYFEVVKHPMDLGQVKKRLENGFYKELSSFESDVKLVFDNCILYNGEDSDVGSVACALKNQFSVEYQAMLKGER